MARRGWTFWSSFQIAPSVVNWHFLQLLPLVVNLFTAEQNVQTPHGGLVKCEIWNTFDFITEEGFASTFKVLEVGLLFIISPASVRSQFTVWFVLRWPSAVDKTLKFKYSVTAVCTFQSGKGIGSCVEWQGSNTKPAVVVFPLLFFAFVFLVVYRPDITTPVDWT